MSRQQRRTYVLTPNHKTTFPPEIVYFDTETYFDPDVGSQVQPFRLGVLRRQRYKAGVPSGRTDEIVFHSPRELFDYLEGRLYGRRKIWVMAHNMDFDFGAVEGFSQLSSRGFKVTFWAFAPRVFLLRAEKNGGVLQFIDSGGYLTTSIKALGKRVGVAKLEMPPPDGCIEDWTTYCRRDTEILQVSFESYMEFVRSNDLGRLALTGPGQAVTAYRHRFMRDKLVLHNRPKLVETERSMYHGGRTEAFYIGEVNAEQLYYLDVNSMYPFVMREKSYPCEFIGVELNPTRSLVNQAFRHFEVGGDVTVELPEPAIPYVSDKLLFPVGQFRTVLAGPEFHYCYERGWCRRIHKLYLYRRGRPFVDYIDFFWERRQQFKQSGDEVHEWMCKLLHNSLYGKFGQRNPEYETFDNAEGIDDGIYYTVNAESLQREIRLVIGDRIWIKCGDYPSNHTFYPLAAWVTSYARVYLWDLIKQGGEHNVYYCDTDSLFVNRSGYGNLLVRVNDDNLGALSIKKTGSVLDIRGAKDYALDGAERIKGVPRTAERVPSLSGVQSEVRGIEAVPVATPTSGATYRYQTFDRVRTRLRRGTQDQVVQKEVTKTLKRQYDKGIVTPTGWVEPYRLDL